MGNYNSKFLKSDYLTKILVLVLLMIITIVFSNNVYAEDIEKKTIDVTNAVTDTSTISHDCNDYAVNVYDKTSHWKECSICSGLYKEAGRPNDPEAWTINNSQISTNVSGENILIINDTKAAHNYTDGYWTMGNSCSEFNEYVKVCDCGYSPVDNTMENPNHHGAAQYATTTGGHYLQCSVCKDSLSDTERHVNSSNQITGCDTKRSGKCKVCGVNDVPRHGYYTNSVNGEPFGICILCGKGSAETDSKPTNVTWTIDYSNMNSIKVTTVYTLSHPIRTFDHAKTMLGNSYLTVVSDAQYTLSNGNKTITVVGTVKFNQNVEAAGRLSNSIYYYDSDNEFCYASDYTTLVDPEKVAPTITNIDSASQGVWNKNLIVTISGTENYCGSVNISVYDSSTNELKYSGKASVNTSTREYSHTFSPNIWADSNGKNYIFKVEDSFGNVVTETKNFSKIDGISPAILESTFDEEGKWATTPTTWSKTKDFNISAQDLGINVADIKIQDVVNGVGSGTDFVDGYGYTTKNESTTPKTWTREYEFTGNVKGYKALRVRAKDPLDNESSTFFRVYNLDNTAPKITEVSGAYYTISAKLSDNISGVNGYLIQAGDTSATQPDVNNASIWEAIDPSLTEQEVHTLNPENTDKVYSLGVPDKAEGTYTIWIKDQAGNTAYNVLTVEKPEEFSTNYIEKTTVDVTTAELITSASSHNCNNYAMDVYDKTYHWKECGICSKEYNDSGRPDSTSSWENVGTYLEVNINASGYRILNIINTFEQHSFNDYWTLGSASDSANCCSASNWHNFVCDCGYTYSNTDGKKAHSSNLIWNSNLLFHIKKCPDCGDEKIDGIEYSHVDVNGTPIVHPVSVNTTCRDCGVPILANYHEANIEYDNYTKSFKVPYGNCYFGDISIIDMNSNNNSVVVDYNKDAEGFITITYSVEAAFDVSSATLTSTPGQNTRFYNTEYGEGKYISGPVVNGNTITYQVKAKFADNVSADTYAFVVDSLQYSLSSGAIYGIALYAVITPEENAPSANVQINSTSNNGWSTENNITVSGTEDYCSVVKIKMKRASDEEVVYEGTTLVNNNQYSCTFSPDLSVSDTSEEFIFEVSDSLYNTTTITRNLYRVDNIAPTFSITSTDIDGYLSTIPTTWSKNKNLSISATDDGVNLAKIKIQDISDGLGIGTDFVDGYGYTTKNESTTPKTWTREYEFTGNVKGYKALRVRAKDPLDNESSTFFRVYNLDNTPPKITEVSGAYYTISAKLSDNISGVNGYLIQDGDTRSTTPDVNDASIWEAIDPSLTGQEVHTVNPENTDKVYSLGVPDKAEGTYTIWIKDQAGNVASAIVNVEPIATNHIDKLTVDVTDAVTDNSTITHNCSNYAIDVWDTTYHWKECRICSALFKEAGSPNSSEWENEYLELKQNESGENILVIKNSKVAHDYTSYWTQGESCHPNNKYRHMCKNCDYSYEEDNTRSHGHSSVTTRPTVDVPTYRYAETCDVCGYFTSIHLCIDNDNNLINCNNPNKICSICGFDYSTCNYIGHKIGYELADNTPRYLKCEVCNKQLVYYKGSTITREGSNKITLKSEYTWLPNYTHLWTSYFTSSAELYGGKTGSFSISGDTAITIISVTNPGNFEEVFTFDADTSINVSNNEQWSFNNYLNTSFDIVAPTITTLTHNSIDSSQGWSLGESISISGSEEYCSSVKVTMIDVSSNEEVYSTLIPVNNTTHTYSHEFTPTIDVNSTSGVYSIEVEDTVGNKSIETVTLQNVDNIAPLIIENPTDDLGVLTTLGSLGWSRTKDMEISAQDSGVEIAEIKIQDVTNGLGSGVDFVDDYGYTEKDESTDPDTWTRNYTFTGNVKGYKTLRVRAKDPLDNESSTFFRVYNLDNTAPIIDESSITLDSLNRKLQVDVADAFSGIRKFGLIKLDTQTPFVDSMYPTQDGGTNTTHGTELNKWYSVSLVPANGNIPESGQENITVTFDIEGNGYYVIVAEDYLGNRANLPYTVALIDVASPTGSIRVTHFTRSNYATLIDPVNVEISPTAVPEGSIDAVGNAKVVLEIAAADDLSGVSKIAVFNEDSVPEYNNQIEWHDWATWEALTLVSGDNNGNATKKMNWELTSGDGVKTVYLYLQDGLQKTSIIVNDKYIVNYDLKGGINGPEVGYKQTGETYNISSVVPTREGYTFKGWDTNSNGTNVVYTGGAEYTTDADLFLYAVWEYTSTPIISVTNHNKFAYVGTGAGAYYVSTTQSTKPIAGSTTASSTFALDTWTTATSTGNLTLSENQTYYVWAKDMVTGGQVSSNPASIVTRTVTRSQGTGTTLTTKYDSSTGSAFTTATVYVLNGSKVNVSGSLNTGYMTLLLTNNSTTISEGDQTINANASFTSSASEQTATLSYDANGHGTAPASVTMTYTQAATAAGEITGVVGYTFAGWKDGIGNTYGAGAQVKAANVIPTSIVLYAQWTEATATLTYNNGGHGTAPGQVTMSYSAEAKAAGAITADGWTFNGWQGSNGVLYAAGQQIKAANVVPSSLTLTATWTSAVCGGTFYLYNPSKGTLENPDTSSSTLTLARNGAYCNRCKRETYWYYDSWFIYKCDRCGATERHETPSTRWWCSSCLEYIHVDDYKVHGEKMRSFDWRVHND